MQNKSRLTVILREMLKHFSDIICGQTIALYSSNDVTWWPPTVNEKKRVKEGLGMARVT